MNTDVFVVDDEPELRELVSFHLETAGYDVATYPDGEACWQQLQGTDSPPDVLLVDVMMPNMNGFQLLKAVRDGEGLSELPVIMLTARGTETDVVQGFDIGATDYLTKPFRSQELLARIGRYV
ncbi:response regulator transcription factor [Halalkalicoccus jeotgali]|uniref:Response regulator receiver protein n=1 Tax=Halalkalicoccus jeotgali (strain DSM 18796 / CECT 7217 / JCM 14584 / KCTC 4019 / B3) TaxID=795797 RepID=D8JAI4_HALJB|nr:response regulator [Halalkalicoccus jeotgali]ADJ14706.1 response regulator receiver protein [Halalkalicoccus jeotgali B3]ELY39502.1 response regulator receiver protein [Halalkalicoccus jeotgali B3]